MLTSVCGETVDDVKNRGGLGGEGVGIEHRTQCAIRTVRLGQKPKGREGTEGTEGMADMCCAGELACSAEDTPQKRITVHAKTCHLDRRVEAPRVGVGNNLGRGGRSQGERG